MQKMKRSCLQLDILLLAAVLVLQGCGGGGKKSSNTPPVSDTTPSAFTFASQSDVAADTAIESAPVTISGINAPAPVSITGGEYSINGAAYSGSPGTISNNQQVRIRVQSSSSPSGQASATLSIGGVSGTFMVQTAASNSSDRVEAEAATATGGASTVADAAASNGEAVSVGAASRGISVAESQDARALILAYRTDTAGTLEVTVNATAAGTFALTATTGVYATASLEVSLNAGDVIAITSPSAAGASETYIDYVQFADSIFKSVSTLAETTAGTSDGVSVAANGDIYVSGGAGGQQIVRVTPDGVTSVFATGLVSANGSDFDSNGNLYVADYGSSSVRKISTTGVVSTFAAGLDGPGGVWVDQNDNVLVSLYGAGMSGTGAKVLSIAPNGTVSTYAAGGGLQDVVGIVGDDNGQVYASNWASGALYKITGGTVTLLAQTGGTANQICYNKGYIYIPSPTGARVRRVSLSGTVENVVGTGVSKTVDGLLDVAAFMRPNSCDFSADGTILYVVDRDSGRLRKVDSW